MMINHGDGGDGNQHRPCIINANLVSSLLL